MNTLKLQHQEPILLIPNIGKKLSPTQWSSETKGIYIGRTESSEMKHL